MRGTTWRVLMGRRSIPARAQLMFVLILLTVLIFVFFSEIDKDFGRIFAEKRLVVIKIIKVTETPTFKTSTLSSDGNQETSMEVSSEDNQRTHVEEFRNISGISEEEPVAGEKHIFFLETRCVLRQSENYTHRGLLLNEKQACSLESAAKMNPDYKVYLLYSCPVIGGLADSEEYVKAVFTYPNVKVCRLNITRRFSNTPIEKWDFNAAIHSSKWRTEHASDVLRLLTLWKYGGTYLDLDIILLKSIDELGTNYVAQVRSDEVANGVLNFAHEGIGHDVATMCAYELRDSFRGDDWAYNGPGVITRIMLKYCKVAKVPQLSTQNCIGFKILSSEEFFPISYNDWRNVFDVSQSNETLYRIRNSYGVHLWNKVSKEEPIEFGSKQAISIMAQHSCPRLYKLRDSM